MDRLQTPEETDDILERSSVSGIVLVYSVTDPDSLDHARKLKAQIDAWTSGHMHKLRKKVPVVLVGNKADLQPQRTVSSSQGKQVAADIDCQAFHEVSAVDGRLEVEHVFTDLLQHMRVAKKDAAKAAKIERRHAHLSKSTDSLDTIGSWQDDHQESNTLKKVVAALKHLQFISPQPSPVSSRRSSPNPSPRGSRDLSTSGEILRQEAHPVC